MTTLCTTKETDFLNIIDYSDPSQGIGKMVPIATARAAPDIQKALEKLLLRWEDYIHLIDPNDDPGYKTQAIDYGNEARALLKSLKG